MQSEAIESSATISGGQPTDPATTPADETAAEPLPECSWSDPLCTPESDGGTGGSGGEAVDPVDGDEGGLQCS